MAERRVLAVPPTPGELHLRPAGGWTTDTLPAIGQTVVVWAITETALAGGRIAVTIKGQVLVIDDEPDEVWPVVVAWEVCTQQETIEAAAFPVVGELLGEVVPGLQVENAHGR